MISNLLSSVSSGSFDFAGEMAKIMKQQQQTAIQTAQMDADNSKINKLAESHTKAASAAINLKIDYR